jgi:predicted DCC family thiol-disulfide oxidoreductase YuxK
MPDTLFYDSQCPLCSGEIARLQDLKDDSLVLRDIHTVDDRTLPSRDTLLRDLHLQTSDGELLTGIDANVAAWQHTKLGFFWRCLRWRFVKPVANYVYRHWARWRYSRLYGQPIPDGMNK